MITIKGEGKVVKMVFVFGEGKDNFRTKYREGKYH